ncbi:hypothetical protein ACVDFE_09905 [Lentzea chajnantorensis]
MRRDPRAYLWDAVRATELLAEFSDGKSFADYVSLEEHLRQLSAGLS